MRSIQALLLILSILVWSGAAVARDTHHQYPIADVFANPEFAAQLEGVDFYFGDQAHPPVAQSFGEDRTNKKTNAFNKSDEEACQWVMLSALLQLKQRANELGANAVINIRSNYKNNVISSETEYTCGAGGIMAGAALIGEFVVIE